MYKIHGPLFQALRIQVNREFSEIRDGLEAAVQVLRPGGKIGVLTWKHSECAILVDYSRRNEVAGPEAPIRVWYENELAKKTKGLKKVPKKVRLRLKFRFRIYSMSAGMIAPLLPTRRPLTPPTKTIRRLASWSSRRRTPPRPRSV